MPNRPRGAHSVMSDPNTFISLGEAARLLPARNGKRVHTKSIARWITAGVDGVRLKGWKAGRTWMTTPAAVEEFTAALAAKAAGGCVGPAARLNVTEAPARRTAGAAKAAAELDAAGL